MVSMMTTKQFQAAVADRLRRDISLAMAVRLHLARVEAIAAGDSGWPSVEAAARRESDSYRRHEQTMSVMAERACIRNDTPAFRRADDSAHRAGWLSQEWRRVAEVAAEMSSKRSEED